MNSGIGPKDQLEKAKIPVKVDLPVGQFFQDHPGALLNMVVANKETYPDPDEHDINDFIENGKGPLANVLQIFAQAFLVSSETKKETDKEWPDIQFITGLNATGLVNGENQWLNFVILGRPNSVGKVTLNKQDPMKPLDVNPNYFDTDRDIKIIVEGVKIAQKVAESKAVRDVGVTLDKNPIPECKKHTFGTDDYWTCWARQLTSTVWHPVGTCRMGKINDPKAVVDPTLKVKGVKGLRVIDNSVQPAITNANTNAPAILIGQKGADMILNEWMAKDDAKNLKSNSNTKHTEL
jgi:choline dehydrogenase-like flavoprotein